MDKGRKRMIDFLKEKFPDYLVEEVATEMFNVSKDPFYVFAITTKIDDDQYIVLTRLSDGYDSKFVSDLDGVYDTMEQYFKASD
ncbi:MAG: hypothetical protein GF411_08470 [Candidatus Lokiarchaeota archaeon]|nr:hypothetical protein [Candidatus Lokiarchaeota archaeon]